jgi:hypothetical protein
MATTEEIALTEKWQLNSNLGGLRVNLLY